MSIVLQDIIIVNYTSSHGSDTQWSLYSRSIDFVRGIIPFGGVVIATKLRNNMFVHGNPLPSTRNM
jgi:hypothetical protein